MSTQMRLNFVLPSSGKLFLSGTIATGVLNIYTLNDAKIKRIKVGVIGKISIEADENGISNTIEKAFYNSEEHIFHSSDLNNVESDEQVIEYAVPLESNLPPSIVLKEGNIIYYLYASMEEEFSDGKIQNVNTEATISVNKLVDCNTIPKADKKKAHNSITVRGCLCIQSHEQNDTLQICPRVYVPGDCIKINAVVFNAHSYPLSYVQVALIQKVKLKYEDKLMKVVKSAQRLVSETKHGCLMPEQVQVWHEELLRIPPVAPSTNNKNLKVTYKLQLLLPARLATEALDIASNSSILLEVPVVIGNLPLESTLSYFNAVPRGEPFGSELLPIPRTYQEYARGEKCTLTFKGSKFVPTYITYVSERAMDNIELE